MKIPNNYVVIPQDKVLIPMDEYNYLRDELAAIKNDVARTKEWIITEYMTHISNGYKPTSSSISTKDLAILLNINLDDIKEVTDVQRV